MSDFLDWSTLIYRAPALLIAMALHEYAHAYVSDSLGDPTPSMQGRLTANPLVHLDMVGLMLLWSAVSAGQNRLRSIRIIIRISEAA